MVRLVLMQANEHAFTIPTVGAVGVVLDAVFLYPITIVLEGEAVSNFYGLLQRFHLFFEVGVFFDDSNDYRLKILNLLVQFNIVNLLH